MTPVYHLSFFRFLWNLITIPGAAHRYDGSANCVLFYRAFAWLEFLRCNYLEWGRWTIRFTTSETLPMFIGYVDDFGEFVQVISMKRDGGPLVWQDPWSLQAYRYYDDEKTIYRI